LQIDSTHASVNASKAVNYISGHQLQKYRDYAMGLNEAAGQMGGSVGEAFLNETGGTDFLRKMQKEGVGLKEMGDLSGKGAAQMGSMFRSSQVIDAVALENKGHGSAEQNMQRMGILGAAGTQDPSQNLSKLIEEGMQRGLNSSKAIDMIVENTAQMTEENARAGGTADPTNFLTSILGAINKDNPNKELGASIAYKTYQSEEGARHNTSTSFSGMINIARNQKSLGLEDDAQGALLMTQIPTAMLNSFKGKPKQFKEFLEGRGMMPSTLKKMEQNGQFKDDKAIDALNVNASTSEFAQQSGVGYAKGDPGKMVAMMLKHRKDKAWQRAVATGRGWEGLATEEERNIRAPIAAGYSINGGNATAGILNVQAIHGLSTAKENANTLAGEVNATKKVAQDEKRRGNRADAGTAIEGGGKLGADAGGGEGIKQLAETGRIAFEKAGKDAEKTWGDAAAQTAINFGKSAIDLNKATGKLDSVATDLITGTAAWKVVGESFETTMKNLATDLAALNKTHLGKDPGEKRRRPGEF
jgi:hypothetical protein